jgi:hypothetical protein
MVFFSFKIKYTVIRPILTVYRDQPSRDITLQTIANFFYYWTLKPTKRPNLFRVWIDQKKFFLNFCYLNQRCVIALDR